MQVVTAAPRLKNSLAHSLMGAISARMTINSSSSLFSGFQLVHLERAESTDYFPR